MGHINGWGTSFSTYNNAGLLTAHAYEDNLVFPNTFNVNNVSKLQFDGYFSNLNNVIDVNNITCNHINSNNICDQWNIHEYTISFKLWVNDSAYPCQINFENVNGGNNGDYVFWTATCPYDLDFNRVRYYIYVYGDNNTNVGFGINSYVNYWINESSAIINNQNNNTQSIINNQNNQTQQILDSNTTYEENGTQFTNETQEVNNYTQAQDNLINSLDLNMSILDGITINPNASSYIWSIVDRLRQINPAIILLMTSILGMGIIKMVLNR